MRNLSECQAEVFRRSEKRIKQRKQRRKRILISCIPLVLCISVFTAFILPSMLPKGSQHPDTAKPEMSELTQETYTSLSCAIVEISVTGNGFTRSYTDTATVLEISDRLSACALLVPESSDALNSTTQRDETTENTDDFCGSEVFSDYSTTGYNITVISHNGSKTVYYLSGSTLKNLTANQCYTLSEEQLKELTQLLDGRSVRQ